MSSYYFFSSNGSRNKSKWDNFDENFDGGKEQSAANPCGGSVELVIKRLQGLAHQLEELKRKKLDQIAHEMANNEAVRNNSKLAGMRKACVTRISHKLLPLCNKVGTPPPAQVAAYSC